MFGFVLAICTPSSSVTYIAPAVRVSTLNGRSGTAFIVIALFWDRLRPRLLATLQACPEPQQARTPAVPEERSLFAEVATKGCHLVTSIPCQKMSQSSGPGVNALRCGPDCYRSCFHLRLHRLYFGNSGVTVIRKPQPSAPPAGLVAQHRSAPPILTGLFPNLMSFEIVT